MRNLSIHDLIESATSGVAESDKEQAYSPVDLEEMDKLASALDCIIKEASDAGDAFEGREDDNEKADEEDGSENKSPEEDGSENKSPEEDSKKKKEEKPSKKDEKKDKKDAPKGKSALVAGLIAKMKSDKPKEDATEKAASDLAASANNESDEDTEVSAVLKRAGLLDNDAGETAESAEAKEASAKGTEEIADAESNKTLAEVLESSDLDASDSAESGVKTAGDQATTMADVLRKMLAEKISTGNKEEE